MTEKIYCGKCNNMLYFGEEIKRRLYMRAIPNEENSSRLLTERLPQMRQQFVVEHCKNRN